MTAAPFVTVGAARPAADAGGVAAPVPGTWCALLVIVAAARLLLQVLAMPPYAGLDEGFHVARVE
ncbi:MAG: hypothetical protein ACM3NW_12045, partial [Syntrophomonadaceae bacterium]